MRTQVISDGQGGERHRPKGQDIKPKAFPQNATHMILFNQPTDRYILWIIAHYPYFLNGFFVGDVIEKNPHCDFANNDLSHPLFKYQLHLASLISRGLVKRSKDLNKHHLTFTGNLYRITTHPGFPLIATSLTIIVIIIALLNYAKPGSTKEVIIYQPQELNKGKSIEKKPDSSLLPSVQIQSAKDSVPSLKRVHNPKTSADTIN